MNPRQQADSCPTSHLAQRAGTHGPGSARHLGHYQGEAPLLCQGRGLAAHSQEATRPLAQGVVVGRAQCRRAGEGRHGVHPQGRGQGRDRAMTHSAATQGTAIGGTPGSVDGVRRILDGREGRLRAGTRRVGAAQTQQRAQPRHPVLVAANRRNRAQRRGAGPAREAQQHGLRLIIHRVPQQHGCSLAQRKRAQGGETSVTG